MAFTPRLITWKSLPKSVRSTRTAKNICRPRPQARMRILMARLWVEISQARLMMTMRPRIPVNRPILSHDFQNQLPLVGLLGGDPERIFDHFRGFLHAVFARVIDPAEDRSGVYLLTHFHL